MTSSKEILDKAKAFETAHKMLDALEIIKNKKVWVAYLLKCDTCEDYNNGIFDFGKENHLTQEEFDLLKEVLQ